MTGKLVLEMTPVCVNKTAIYHIAMDSLSALSEMNVGVNICGRPATLPRDEAERAAAAQAFFGHVGAWSSGSPHDDELAPTRRELRPEGESLLFFDPIYTLYYDLTSNDTVFVLDLSTLTNVEWHSPAVVRCYERAFRKLAASGAHILSISEHCTAMLRANFPISGRDITTIPLYMRNLPKTPPDDCGRNLSSRRFLLFVGSMESRKNIVGLITAFALSGLSAQGWKLALAGGKGQGWEDIHATAAKVDGVELLGFVSDDELAWLYANAAAFVYPSYLEGFGVPLLEAMSHGLPCMASITGASSEVCGDLGILVDPHHMISVVDGLVQCARMAESGEVREAELKARAGQFTFERYLAVLQAAVSRGRNGDGGRVA